MLEPVELRILTGPNLYFVRPAVKLVLNVYQLSTMDAGMAIEVAGHFLPAGARPGPPGSPARLAFAARLLAGLTRAIATATDRRVPVLSRVGPGADEVTIAFPWRRRGKAEALARAVAVAADGLGTTYPGELIAMAKAAVDAAPVGERARMLRPRIPVIAVTGTNGKTTTTRLIAHIGQADGRVVGWSNTDGIVIDGEVVEEGDWSGPGGAARVLGDPRVDLAVLETARGGILLRGIGAAWNDVAVVTNISADHLGMHGIDTLDQLAEVKATITRITKPSGWVVLNADDERTAAMAASVRARPWLFSLDPQSTSLASALATGGRGITVLDGVVVIRELGFEPTALIGVTDIPLTLGGLSQVNLANALAAAAAALAIGIPAAAVAAGLHSFEPDPEHNPGRMNLYHRDGVTVIVDLAHNEAGLAALLDVAEGLRAPGGEIWTVLGTAGDRLDEALHAMGAMAASRSDHMIIAEKEKYLRDRKLGEMTAIFRGGAAEGGMPYVDSVNSELDGLQAVMAEAGDGDVVALMCHAERSAIHAWLLATGAQPGPVG